MKFYTRYDAPKDKGLDQSGEKTRTRQSEAAECDINKIMERFNRTGKLPTTQVVPPRYGDARVVDYQTAQTIIIEAKNQFGALPAKVRKAFANDPQVFLEALQDTSVENSKKLKDLGIIVERKATDSDVLRQIAENTKPAEKSAEQK